MTPVPTSVPSVPRPASGRFSRTSSRAKSALSEGPSEHLVDGLEKLGSIDKRHEELKKRVDDLENEMKNKANKDDVSGSMSFHVALRFFILAVFLLLTFPEYRFRYYRVVLILFRMINLQPIPLTNEKLF